MKPTLIVANFKSNKTKNEAEKWLEEISNIKNLPNISNKKIIVCPPFTLLDFFKTYILGHDLPLEIGAQNISGLPEGAYTGEINGAQIREFTKYVLIGHSERRSGFGEDENIVEEKVKMSIDFGLIPILCIQGEDNNIPNGVSIIAYEPVFAIGTGTPDTPENAENVARKTREKANLEHVLYGGSVTGDNVKNFTEQKNIDGVLVGGASLEASEFIKIIENA